MINKTLVKNLMGISSVDIDPNSVTCRYTAFTFTNPESVLFHISLLESDYKFLIQGNSDHSITSPFYGIVTNRSSAIIIKNAFLNILEFFRLPEETRIIICKMIEVKRKALDLAVNSTPTDINKLNDILKLFKQLEI